MILVCGTDKFIIRRIHQIPYSLNLRGHIIHKLLRCDPGLPGLQFDLLPVLVRARLKKHVISLAPLVPRDRIRQHNLIRISNMRFAGRIGDRRCNIILLFHTYLLFFLIGDVVKCDLTTSPIKIEPVPFWILPCPFRPFYQPDCKF